MRRKRGLRSLHGDRPNVGELPVEEDVKRELESHIEMRTEELVARGWDPAAAREEALRVFGDMEDVTDECAEVTRSRDRVVRRAHALDALGQDLRYAARTLRSSPGFTAVALLTLALGIGANTAIFSVVDGVLLEPLPYPEPDELVWVREVNTRGGTMAAAWANYRDWRAESRSFEGLVAYGRATNTVLGTERPFRARTAAVGRDFWTLFPVSPLRGRLTTADDHQEGAEPVVLVSEGLWKSELGSEGVGDLMLEYGGTRYRVVGVLPATFDFPSGTDMWRAVELGEKSEYRSSHNWSVVGRLADGVSVSRAREELAVLTERLVSESGEDPDYLATDVAVAPLHDEIVGDSRRPLLLLLGAAGLVLLVACTNLASTLLARGTSRERELAVRASLGAGRGRIVRQLLTESLVLAGLGAVAGTGLAVVVVRVLQAMGPAAVPRLGEIGVDGGVLVFTGVVTVVTALLFGLLPALRLTGDGLSDALRAGGRGNAPGHHSLVWRLLVGAEVALALVLLVGSGLLIRSIQELLAEDVGFDAADVVVTPVSLSQIEYETPHDHRRWYEGLLGELEARPGVEAVGITSTPPVNRFVPNGRVELDGDLQKHADGLYVVASGGYFDALDIPVLQGRVFDERDRPDAPHVAVVSRSFAERYWPGEDPIGRQVTGGGMDNFWEERTFATVIGVVGDVRYRTLGREPEPTLYFPYTQRPFRIRWGSSLVVEAASGDPGSVTGAVRNTVRRLEPDVLLSLGPMRERLADSLGERRFTMMILGGFSVVALLLAAVGIFGVVSYTVARRTREMGVRMALGAERGTVVRMVVSGAMAMVVGGLAVGAGGAFLLTRLMGSLLYRVDAGDPVTLAAVVAILAGVAFLASWIPARAGARIDPMVSMRAE